jgi:ABC-2 type transport system ATP-binding protein
MDELAIKVEDLSKDFLLPHEKVTTVKGAFTSIFNRREVQHALKDISFEVKKGEFFGIVGRNGSGKSTLLKILAEIYQPTKGAIQTHGKLVPFIELGVGFNPELTGRENVYLNAAMMGFSKKETDDMYDDIVSFAELEKFMDQKLKNYSSGMQVRLAFSVATRAQADILLVDEVLAVGDADFQRKCYRYFKELKKSDTTVVFVTHDMEAVREFCDRAMLIENSVLKFIGPPHEVSREYSLLFMNEKPEVVTTQKQRWGSGDAKFLEASAKISGGKIKVSATAGKVTRHIDKIIYGIHIFSQDGTEITATNNRLMSLPDVADVEPGATIKFEWELLNIFNDGQYSVTLTLVDDEQTALDWYSGVASFTVKRAERSVTSVIPPLKVSAKLTEGSKK